MTGTGVHDAATANAQAQVIDGTLNASDASGAMAYALGHLFPGTASWDGTKCYAYAGGTNSAEFVGEYISPTARLGLHNATMPNQIACCVTLRTGLSGRRYRGRMYLPAGGLTLDAAGTLPQQYVTGLANAWALAFQDIDNSAAGTVVVMSSTGSLTTKVTQVTVDDRADIQRRRANREAVPFTAVATVQSP